MFFYADMVGGAAGDMIVGAMIDCGLPLLFLQQEIDKLKITGIRLSSKKVMRQGVECVKFEVSTTFEHKLRSFQNIRQLIESSDLDEKVKSRTIKIFQRLAQAEGEVHNIPPTEIHFHEVGAADSIADIVGAALGMEYFGAEGFYLSDFLFGKGTVECTHGVLPLPAPATVILTKGHDFRFLSLEGELTTPTGSAILTTYSLGKLPSTPFTAKTVGYGAGSMEFNAIPGYLRLWLLEAPLHQLSEEREIVIEANIDDMSAEIYPYVMERLFYAGAREVYFTPIYMKKGRPGMLITVVTEETKLSELGGELFRQTSTIGLRWYPVNRWKLPRSTCEVTTPWGIIKAKKIVYKEGIRIYPEYEECRALAEKAGVPLSEVYRAVISAGNKP